MLKFFWKLWKVLVKILSCSWILLVSGEWQTMMYMIHCSSTLFCNIFANDKWLWRQFLMFDKIWLIELYFLSLLSVVQTLKKVILLSLEMFHQLFTTLLVIVFVQIKSKYFWNIFFKNILKLKHKSVCQLLKWLKYCWKVSWQKKYFRI